MNRTVAMGGRQIVAMYVATLVWFTALLDEKVFCQSERTPLRSAKIVEEDRDFVDDPQDDVRIDLNSTSIHGRLSRSEMEEMLYGTLGGSRLAFRRARRDTIQRYVDRIDRVCSLTEMQKKKIDQSIDIDIARTESVVASLLSEVTEKTHPSRKQQIYNHAWQSVHSLQSEQREDQKSLWFKVLHANLTNEQSKMVLEDEKQVAQHRINAQKFHVLLLAQRKGGLNSIHRKALSDFLFRTSSIENFEQLIQALEALSIEERSRIIPAGLWDKLKSPSLQLPRDADKNLP